jgi:hypothetical protein
MVDKTFRVKALAFSGLSFWTVDLPIGTSMEMCPSGPIKNVRRARSTRSLVLGNVQTESRDMRHLLVCQFDCRVNLGLGHNAGRLLFLREEPCVLIVHASVMETGLVMCLL